MTNKLNQFTTHNSLLINFAVLDYSGTHSLNAHTNCISNFNIRNRLSALTSFARQRLASLLSQNNSLNCFVRQSRKSAFTLAETLIVMGIIGVVAALTLPNLNSSTGDKEKVVKVKKIIQNINEAYLRAEAIYGPVDEWCSDNCTTNVTTNKHGERITEFMKISKNCGVTKGLGCFTKGNTMYVNGTKDSNLETYSYGRYSFITADGTSVFLSYGSPLCDKNRGVSCPGPYCQTCGLMAIDIDGPSKGPYVLGKDLFTFYYDKDYGLIPQGGENENGWSTDAELKAKCFATKDCTAWIVNNENTDYLKVDSSGKCPNGTVLSRTVISCK